MKAAGARNAIRDLCNQFPDERDEQIAARLLPSLKDHEVTELALMHLAQMVWEHKRYGQLCVERASSGDHAGRVFGAIMDDPALLYGPRDQWATEATHPGIDSVKLGQRHYREGFVRKAGARFDAWYKRAEETAKRSGNLDSFNFHWGEKDYGNASGLLQAVNEAIATVKAELRLELTKELLETEFAIGDGIRVTWGEATIDQHQRRIAMLRGNAMANIEAAARHEAAVDILTQAHKPCLADVAAQRPARKTARRKAS